MVLKKFLEKLDDPEYYMEIEKYDIRLAVSKINDFIETLGDASISATYSNKIEYTYTNVSDKESNIIRRIHIRHAILDFNNSFDLLLQIPWFYFRIWQGFNKGSQLRLNNQKYQNSRDVVRNKNNWVEIAEQNCNYAKVIRYLHNKSNEDLLILKVQLQNFNKKYISNTSKEFTVRTLANKMKHNHSLKLQEFYSPSDFNVNINNEGKLNLRRQKLGLKLESDFYALDKPDETLGKIKVNYWDDLYIDIEYNNGEKFFAKDYIDKKRYTLDSIYEEMIEYGNALIDLYEKILAIIESNITFNPILPNKPTKQIMSVNLDKYFKS